MLTHFHCSLVGVPAKECIIAVIYLPYITERDLWKYAVYSCLLSATTITTKATVRILKKSLRKRDMKKTKKKRRRRRRTTATRDYNGWKREWQIHLSFRKNESVRALGGQGLERGGDDFLSSASRGLCRTHFCRSCGADPHRVVPASQLSFCGCTGGRERRREEGGRKSTSSSWYVFQINSICTSWAAQFHRVLPFIQIRGRWRNPLTFGSGLIRLLRQSDRVDLLHFQ